jgi:hypothetical protein
MLDKGHHRTVVDEWLKRSTKDLPPEKLLLLFEAALAALWVRTHTTLGEVTLTAITERVLHGASEKMPVFATLKVDPNAGILLRELRERIGSAHDAELVAGIPVVIVELLTVLGNLTAEILTPELHRDLSQVAVPETMGGDKAAPGRPTNPEVPPGEGKTP